jgi:NADP-dependent 3-hydroxy acid dehydrogenase YdfG
MLTTNQFYWLMCKIIGYNYQSIEDIKKQFETNLFGAIRTIQQVLPITRNQRSRVIVNISSLAGYVGFRASSVYNSKVCIRRTMSP